MSLRRSLARTRPIIQRDNCGCGSHVMAENQTKLSLSCQETRSAKKATPVSKNLPVKTKLEFAGDEHQVFVKLRLLVRCKNGGVLPSCEKQSNDVTDGCHRDKDCGEEGFCTSGGKCVCRGNKEETWPECSQNPTPRPLIPPIGCERDCGRAGKCREGKCACLHDHDVWPNCCSDDCQVSGGVCMVTSGVGITVGSCVCDNDNGLWPDCCKEDCGRRGVCQGGTCVCANNKEETWPECLPPEKPTIPPVQCKKDCGRGAKCREGKCACIHDHDVWPSCCSHDCQVSGGICRAVGGVGRCFCDNDFGQRWPNCCQEDCRSSGGECNNGKCICSHGKGKWPNCCEKNCGTNGKCLKGNCACKEDHSNQKWPNCCQEDCESKGGECRDGACRCKQGRGEWPECCKEDCGENGECFLGEHEYWCAETSHSTIHLFDRFVHL